MLLVEDVDDRDFLIKLFNTMYDELPFQKNNYINNLRLKSDY